MKKKQTAVRAGISLKGLTLAPAQTWGSVRIVPLVKDVVQDDLRVARRAYGPGAGVVALGGGHAYGTTVLPHGLVFEMGAEGPEAELGTALRRAGDTKAVRGASRTKLLCRMAKREGERSLRVLPLHLAMEGLLALHAGGPGIAWTEYSRQALAHGLSREETSWPARAVRGLADALRVFEIHEGQVGVLVFVADALASAFVLPHPDDFRALYRSLLEDFYGELLVTYGEQFDSVARAEAVIDESKVTSIASLRAALGAMRAEWTLFGELLASGILAREVTSETVCELAPYRLERFITKLVPHEENHIGELLTRDDGSIEYLRTFRLSDAQVRRAYLLEQLASCAWSLADTAARLGDTEAGLVRRLENAGFAYLLKPHVLEAARRRH